MFKHRLISFCLLFAYGIPAAVGPYWHNHHGQATHLACTAVICASHQSDTMSSDVAEESDCSIHCGCSARNETASDRCTAGQAANAPAPVCAFGVHHCSDHCTICAFYAQSQSVFMPCVAAPSATLWAWLRAEQPSAEATHLLSASARGPPADLLSIA